MDIRGAAIVTVHFSKLLNIVQLLLLALCQAGEDLAVARIRVPVKEVQQFQRVLQGTVQCTCGADKSKVTLAPRD